MRMKRFLSLEKQRILFKAFIESQFKYCPLVWMFYGRNVNDKINKLHERSLRMVYDDYTTTFEELLERDNSFSIHHQNIQTLMIEIYKAINNFPGATIKDLFTRVDYTYSLRRNQDVTIPRVNTSLKGQNSIRYLGAIIWNSLPTDIRNIDSLEQFISKIKKWKPVNCPCRLCKTYVKNLGFVDVIP